MTFEMLPYLLAMTLLGIGIYAIAAKKNLIKTIIGIIITGYAVNLFLVLVGYQAGGIAPILTEQKLLEIGRAEWAAEHVVPLPETLDEKQKAAVLKLGRERFRAHAVDPIPQALVVTSIVIGVSLTALMVAIAVRIYDRYGTFDLSQIRKLRG